MPVSKRRASKALDLSEVDVDEIRKQIKKNLSSFGTECLMKSLLPQKEELKSLILETIDYGKSRSVMIIGQRGRGKTMILEQTLDEISTVSKFKGSWLLVELHGAVHTDDRIALKDITRQLKLENTVGDRVFGTFAENLTFLLESLRSGGPQKKSVVFVLDEFDLFCHHKNQSLLYNLFDAVQSAQVSIALIGITNRPDFFELLEKRVKSRFSHCQISLLNPFALDEYTDLAESLLSLPASFCNNSQRSTWNTSVKKLVKDASVKATLKNMYESSTNIRHLKNVLLLSLTRLSEDHPKLEPEDIVESGKSMASTSKVFILKGISVLELCLVISLINLTVVKEHKTFNFETVFNDFKKAIGNKLTMQGFSKAVVMKAFQRLESLEFVETVSVTSSKIEYEYRQMHLLLTLPDVKEAVQQYHNLPTDVHQWAHTVFSNF